MARPGPLASPRRRDRVTRLAVAGFVLWAAVAGGVGAGTGRTPLLDQSGDAAAVRASAARARADELMTMLRTLSSPALQGRRTGTAGGREARRIVREAFAGIGLEPLGSAGYEQPFTFTASGIKGILPAPPSGIEFRDAANVVGRVPGTVPGARALVISAHYDHLGTVGGKVHPGADDNASGVAALLSIARHVRGRPLARPVIFAAFDAEELGLEGARAFVRSPPVPLAAIALNVNLDMVSRSDRREIFAAGTHHFPWLMPPLVEVQRRAAVTLRFGHDRPSDGADDWTQQSDHGEFHKAGVPFVYFGVEDHPDYHKPTDTADKVDPAFFADVTGMLIDAVLTLDARLPVR